jgi:hypothetical protein
MKISGNMAQLAEKYRARARYMDELVTKVLRSAAAAIDRKQVENLSGSGADEPGSYPVPVRKGTLRGGHGFAVTGRGEAAVFNTTAYAMAVHTGNRATNQGVKYAVRPRPFLDEAAAQVDVGKRMQTALRKAFAI